MLVTVAVVSLMMVLFAQVFTLAGASVVTQKGIIRNDQRARTILNMLRIDLESRTFRTVIPFAMGETSPVDPNDPLYFGDNREGYFYISENDPNDGTDDVLQFVIMVEVDVDDPVYGRAASYTMPPSDRNEPEFDDGQSGNLTGSSRFAVVSYFLRHGVLYRRVFLVRTPLNSMNGVTPTNFPTSGVEFWELFDYSAHQDTGTMELVWHGSRPSEDWLDNSQPNALADPRYRFGHHFGDGNVTFDPGDGNPREYDDNDVFFGRYTHQETSDPQFDWPMTDMNQPFDPTDDGTILETLNASGVITEYADGTRRGEDILMQNCHEFDIKVFDDNASGGMFVDIGAASAVDYGNHAMPQDYRSNNPTPSFGDNIFDTWHPGLAVAPPYRPDDGLTPATPIPMRAIQIRLRFFDPESGQMRQMTLQQSLVPRPTS